MRARPVPGSNPGWLEHSEHLRATSRAFQKLPALLSTSNLHLGFNKKQQRELTSQLIGGGNWSGRGRIQTVLILLCGGGCSTVPLKLNKACLATSVSISRGPLTQPGGAALWGPKDLFTVSQHNCRNLLKEKVALLKC